MTTIESKMNFLFEAILKAEADEREAEALEFRAIATKHEKGFAIELESIFQKQKNEVKARLDAVKAIEDLFMFDTAVWKIDTRIMAEKRCKNAMNENGIRVYHDLEKMEKTCKFVLISTTYDMEYPEALAQIEEQGVKLAADVTEITERLIADVIASAFKEGLTIREISALIDGSFDNKKRAEMIARTEVIRAANYGTLSAYKQSGVIEGKEWLTANDEKVCPYCNSMDRKQLGLDDSFLPVGGIFEVTTTDGKPISMTNNYLDTQAPPLHPRCRCTLLPIVKEIIITRQKPDSMTEWTDLKELNEIPDSLSKFGIGWVFQQSPDYALKYTNGIGKFLADTMKARPGLATRLAKDKTQTTISLLDVKTPRENVAGIYNPSTNMIVLGARSKVGTSAQCGDFVVGELSNDDFMHEFAHAIDETVLSAAEKKLWADAVKTAGGLSNLDVVSQYATTNVDEAFAECFVVWAHPLRTAETMETGSSLGPALPRFVLPEGIEDFFEETFKK